jgi:chromate reductase
MSDVRILVFAGSLRGGSFNKQLAAAAAEMAASAGAEVTIIDLRDYPLPLFDEDLEAESGMPQHAASLKKLFLEHNALIISSPEYNSSVSAALKNAIDWVSRRQGDEPMKAAFLGKVAALFSASPGGLGGLRGLVHLRSILQNIGIMVLPDQFALSAAHEAFDQDGNLVHERHNSQVAGIVRQLVDVVQRLNAQS